MNPPVERFTRLSRALHWLMALLILSILFIGIGMVSTVSPRYHELLSVHKSIGMVIFVLAAIRLINRLLTRQPLLPADLPAWQRVLAKASHYILYALMFALPLVGWSMLSAGGYPVLIFDHLELPSILPLDAGLYATLRRTHTILAFLLFGVFLTHLSAALFHALIRRDQVLESIT
jgi:cytochrome b561